MQRRTCEACRIVEATISNDIESGRSRGVKYAVLRTEGDRRG